MKLALVLALATAAVAEIHLETEVLTEAKCTRKTQVGDKVNVHYRGTLASDGSEFDASYNRGSPLNFAVGTGQVIKGWDQGLLDMCPGEKRKLTIQPEWAYGSRGAGPIPANSVLIFESELVSIEGVDKEELTKIREHEYITNGIHFMSLRRLFEHTYLTLPYAQPYFQSRRRSYQQIVGAAPKVNHKKRNTDVTDIFAAKSPTKPKTIAERVSLECMKEDALKAIEERRGAAKIALDGLLPLAKKSEAVETTVAVFEQQIEDYSLSTKKLSLFGRGSEIDKTKDTDS
ncbi:FK506-binding protein 2 [Alternaria panax]|uniref:peptidylprolyl isomerase n=1 Tax=Alternaria panax TaxID=48097 RepID=A0AAD4I8B8_9PLEO|nr:FK506-binding protein 2 [Alternaria panax]